MFYHKLDLKTVPQQQYAMLHTLQPHIDNA
jgi:hypothetical protein